MRRLLPLNLDLALLILRLCLAAIMLVHGIPKLLAFGGVVQGFTGMGVPVPALSAAIATIAEVGGGVLLLLGIATDIAGLLIVVDMLGAIVLVHLKNGFDWTKAGWEYPFTLLCLALGLALSGPGSFAAGKK
jgi:putative oxidoreductase